MKLLYDNNCDKTRYHHRCGGLLLLCQKIMTENGLFLLSEPETQLHHILWAVHEGKNRGRSEGEENIREFRLGWVVGAERCMEVCVFLSYTYVRGCVALGFR